MYITQIEIMITHKNNLILKGILCYQNLMLTSEKNDSDIAKINDDLNDTYKIMVEKKYKSTLEQALMGIDHVLPLCGVEDKKKRHYYIKKKNKMVLNWPEENEIRKVSHQLEHQF